MFKLSIIKTDDVMKTLSFFLLVIFVLLACNCSQSLKKKETKDDLFDGFINPPAESRPFVRWWWNGNHITADEIKRQLEVLHAAGIGGVEINPIAMPEEAADIGTRPIEWLSKELNQLLALAAGEAQQKGMITDMIVGSGWPFGGEFLKEEEMIQRVIIHKIPYSQGAKIKEDKESLVRKAISSQSTHDQVEAVSNDVFFLRLVPVEASDTSEIIDLTDRFRESIAQSAFLR